MRSPNITGSTAGALPLPRLSFVAVGLSQVRQDCNMARGRSRAKPNILLTGTPGTGKTTVARALAEATGMRCINISDLVKDKKLHSGWDDKFDCFVIDEEKVCDEIEDEMQEGGNIVDYHGCDFFPELWFDQVVVLQTETSVLYDRLSNRGYSGSKLSNNMECEIFQILLEEARDCYPEEVVSALQNNTVEEMESHVASLADWVKNWGSTSQ